MKKSIYFFNLLLLTICANCYAQNALSVIDLIVDKSAYRGQTITVNCGFIYALGTSTVACRNPADTKEVYAANETFNKKQLRWLLENCGVIAQYKNNANCQNQRLVGTWDGKEFNNGYVVFRQ